MLYAIEIDEIHKKERTCYALGRILKCLEDKVQINVQV